MDYCLYKVPNITMAVTLSQSVKLAVVLLPKTTIFWSGQPIFKSLLARWTSKNLQKVFIKMSTNSGKMQDIKYY
jgi:hypothetical protein